MSKSNGKGVSPAQQMYGKIQAVHAQLVDGRRAAEHAAKNQIRIPGRPVKQVGINIPKVVVHLDEAVFFLAGQCLALGAAITKLQEQLNERNGDGGAGAGSVIIQEGAGSGGSG